MNQDILQGKVKMLQEKYTKMIMQAAQEGRTADVQSLSNKMQQEIQSIINEGTSQMHNSHLSSSPGNAENQVNVTGEGITEGVGSDIEEIEEDEEE
ncbi:hypothetical protein ACFL5P_02520 [candidate division KSB1 bacterium]